jgi:hypothetical protein
MSFWNFASRMYPYWMLGGLMFWAVWKSDYKDLLKFDLKAFSKFFLFMAVVSVWRFYMIRLAIQHDIATNTLNAAKNLPLGATAFVGWEDLCHSLPLVLLRRMIGKSKWVMPIHILATLMVMGAFFMGHTYQGYLAAGMISLYIPWAVNFGEKKGFGTLVAGHMLYDFLTLGVIKLVLG